MAVKSVYLPHPELDGSRLRITGSEHHHLTVARAAGGRDSGSSSTDAEVSGCRRSSRSAGKRPSFALWKCGRLRSSGPEVILAMSLIKPSAFELALEKAVEVGVTRIIPLIAPARMWRRAAPDRWKRIVIEAAKQSKRYHLPVVDEPCKVRTSSRMSTQRQRLCLQSAVADR